GPLCGGRRSRASRPCVPKQSLGTREDHAAQRATSSAGMRFRTIVDSFRTTPTSVLLVASAQRKYGKSCLASAAGWWGAVNLFPPGAIGRIFACTCLLRTIIAPYERDSSCEYRRSVSPLSGIAGLGRLDGRVRASRRGDGRAARASSRSAS